jgi:ABC-type multidrug transport system permease subunit
MGFKGFCEYWGILTIVAFVGSSFGMTIGCLLPHGTNA